MSKKNRTPVRQRGRPAQHADTDIEKSKPRDQASGTKTEPPPARPTIAIKSASTEYAASERENGAKSKSHGRKWSRNKEATLVFTGVLTLFTGIYSVVSIFQLGALNSTVQQVTDQTVIARQTLEVAQRAYISIREIKIVSFEPHKPVSILITWENTGNSPAILSKSITTLAIGSIVPTESSCDHNKDVTQQLVVSPHNTKIQTVETQMDDFKPDDIVAVKNTTKYLWFCGNVVYTSLGKDYSFPLCSYATGDLALFRECKK